MPFLTFVLKPAARGNVVIQGFFDLGFGIQLLQGPGDWANFGAAGMMLTNNIGNYPPADGNALFTLSIIGPRTTNQRITLRLLPGQSTFIPRLMPGSVAGPVLANGQFDQV